MTQNNGSTLALLTMEYRSREPTITETLVNVLSGPHGAFLYAREQETMARLLHEWDDTWTNAPDLGTRVNATKNGKLTRWPSGFLNYRHPDQKLLAEMRKPYHWDKK